MTLGEGDFPTRINAAYEYEAGDLLKEVILQAKGENRITCGVYQVASKLNMNPKAVLLCLYADDCVADDVLSMHFALIKAFCWENTVPLMKASNHDALYELLKDMRVVPRTSSKGEDHEDDFPIGESVAVTPEDTFCVLIEVPEHKSESEDELLHHHHNMAQCNPLPMARLAS
ncbi:putative growth arrest and DNA damage-inducible protein GADD45 alpha isoform X1 [Apostichopus japonicus]|uniref:Putative growth arrest and DNA damage-inducible protein GADD45 alpha isoform X1 n=1 Tax=Stichopus japonicus TaxID=307972 RepID=A0A2G8KIV4_STIJA|nr:putative growth arrest and DNA damage-inducible protein GADD45 alpha isoform X1 [Apostichopus japonicus]